MKLLKKVILITDADSGSGKAILNRLSAAGAHLILNSSSDGAEIETNLDECRSRGTKVAIVNINLCLVNKWLPRSPVKLFT